MESHKASIGREGRIVTPVYSPVRRWKRSTPSRSPRSDGRGRKYPTPRSYPRHQVVSEGMEPHKAPISREGSPSVPGISLLAGGRDRDHLGHAGLAVVDEHIIRAIPIPIHQIRCQRHKHDKPSTSRDGMPGCLVIPFHPGGRNRDPLGHPGLAVVNKYINTPLVSPLTKLEAPEFERHQRPSAEMDGASLQPFPCSPVEEIETLSVTPVWRS